MREFTVVDESLDCSKEQFDAVRPMLKSGQGRLSLWSSARLDSRAYHLLLQTQGRRPITPCEAIADRVRSKDEA